MSIIDNLRAAFAGKKPDAGPAIANTWPIYEQQTPQYPQPSPYALAKTGYTRNEIVYACVQKRATAVAEPPMLMYSSEADDEDREKLPDHPARALIKRPNEVMSEGEFWQAVEIYLCVAGFSAWEIEFTNGGQPIALWPMRPDWCSFKRGPNRPISCVTYQPQGLTAVDVPIEKVLLFSEFDPLNPMIKGLSRSAVAMRVTAADNAATDFVATFLQRGAIIAGVLKTTQSLTDAEATRIRQRWRDVHGGSTGWGEVAVLGGGTEFQPTQMTFKEMDFGALDGRDEARMCAVFNVPPMLIGAKVGLDASTYSNYKEAKGSFYEESMNPRWKYFESEVQTQLMRYYPDAYCGFDLSDIKALQEDRTAKFQRGDMGFKSGWITRDEARAEAGLDPIDDKPVFASGVPAVGEEETEAESNALPQVVPPTTIPNTQPRPLPGQPEADMDVMGDEEEQLKAWRKKAVESVKAGERAWQPALIRREWEPIAGDLLACKTAGEVRAAFERHWPSKPSLLRQVATTTAATLDDLVREIREARMAIEVSQS
jgi:HK97 family phage portal protein